MMNGLRRQIFFRIDEATAKQLKTAAMEDGRELGPFCRELVEWAFPHYMNVKSISMLKKSKVKYPQLKLPK